MKTFKKSFSFILVFTILISLLPKHTYTEETTTNLTETHKKETENPIVKVNSETTEQKDRVEFPTDTENNSSNKVIRQNVLIIDGSEKMKGKPFELQKQALKTQMGRTMFL